MPQPPLCHAFVAEQRPLASKWRDRTYLPQVLGECYPTKSGAWAIRFERVKPASEGFALSARFTVVHLGSDGRAVPGPFEPSPFAGKSDAPPIPAAATMS